MGDDSVSRNDRNEYLFHHLVAMFQTLALQQLGKLVNPITGKMERDLQQARITIDMLQMIKDRTTGNLEQSERMILERALLELQMNFVDEKDRGEDIPTETAEESEREEHGEERSGVERPAAKEEDVPDQASEADTGSDAPATGKGKKKSKTSGKKRGKKKTD